MQFIYTHLHLSSGLALLIVEIIFLLYVILWAIWMFGKSQQDLVLSRHENHWNVSCYADEKDYFVYSSPFLIPRRLVWDPKLHTVICKLACLINNVISLEWLSMTSIMMDSQIDHLTIMSYAHYCYNWRHSGVKWWVDIQKKTTQ